MSLTLLTSGTTKEPKTVIHSWDHVENYIQRSIKEIKLTQNDVVLESNATTLMA